MAQAILRKKRVTEVSLFNIMNRDRSASISFNEFVGGLQMLDVHCSEEEFKQVYRLCDRSNSNSVSLPELGEFL